MILLIWGTDPYLAFRPLELMGSSEITGLIFDNYTFTMIGLSFLVAFARFGTVSTARNSAKCSLPLSLTAKSRWRWASTSRRYS